LTTQHAQQTGLENAIACARVCEELRGKDTIVLDLSGITPLFDYFVVTTASNRRQMHAVADEVKRMMKERGEKRFGIEGYDNSSWIVEDYGDIILHVFTDESRELYDLENLWADAVRVEWQEDVA